MVVWAANLILPGLGLIARRREWLGFSLALLFGIAGNLAMAGWWIAPLVIPAWAAWLSALGAGLIWILSQVLLRQILRGGAMAR